MPRRGLIAVTAGMLAALMLGYFLAFGTTTPGDRSGGGEALDSETSPSSGRGEAPGSGTSPSSDGGEAPDSEGSGAEATGPAADSAGVEVLPEPSGQPSGLPGLEQTEQNSSAPLIDTPLPDRAAAVGSLATGFPGRILGPSPGSRVLSASVSPSGAALQVALDASSDAAPDSVLRGYRIRLVGLGFAESEVPAVGGSAAAAFTRGDDSVVVTVTPGKREGCSYTVFGTLHAGGA